MNRGSTPVSTQNQPGLPDWFAINANGLTDFPLEDYPARDLFRELLIALHAEGIKVIAYMAAQGPTFLKHDETRAYDYNNLSPYVDSVAECNSLTNGEITDGTCSPGARRWRNYVTQEYGSDSDENLERAWAEKILYEYANKYNGENGEPNIDAFWFDQGKYMNIPLARQIIRDANPTAAVAFNEGQKIPLINNNPPHEDFTAGHPNPIKNTPPYDDINLPIITSVENSLEGYLESDGSYSLAHVFQMTNNNWNNGDLVWDDKTDKAIDWMSRVLAAKGAWTWNVKRSFYPTKLHEDDVSLLKIIYAGLPDSPSTAAPSSSPSSSPSISSAPSAQDEQCVERNNDEYVRVDNDGVERSYSCLFLRNLSIENRERSRRICRKDSGVTSAQNVCPRTCGPFLEETEIFSLRKKDGSEVQKTCKLLVDLETTENFERITKICAMTDMGSPTFAPASTVCEIACGRNANKDMEFKFTKKNGAEKSKTCRWLYKLSLRKPNRVERICKAQDVADACPFVCNPCI